MCNKCDELDRMAANGEQMTDAKLIELLFGGNAPAPGNIITQPGKPLPEPVKLTRDTTLGDLMMAGGAFAECGVSLNMVLQVKNIPVHITIAVGQKIGEDVWINGLPENARIDVYRRVGKNEPKNVDELISAIFGGVPNGQGSTHEQPSGPNGYLEGINATR